MARSNTAVDAYHLSTGVLLFQKVCQECKRHGRDSRDSPSIYDIHGEELTHRPRYRRSKISFLFTAAFEKAMTALFCGAQQKGAAHMIALWERVSATVFICVSGFDNVLRLALVMRCLGGGWLYEFLCSPFTMQPHATGFSSDLPSKKVLLRRLAGSISSAVQHTTCPFRYFESGFIQSTALKLVTLVCKLVIWLAV